VRGSALRPPAFCGLSPAAISGLGSARCFRVAAPRPRRARSARYHPAGAAM
jgi:hypothetical protein